MKSRALFITLLFGIGWALSACGPGSGLAATPTPLLALPSPPANETPLPTSPPLPTAICPNPDCVVVTPAALPSDPLTFSLPTPGAEPVSAWRPPQFPVPLALSPYDHFYFARPIGADEINWPLASYRYGGVFFSSVTHTGVDIPGKPGTPVLAAGPGTVVWADWGLFSGVPDNYKDPYGRAVAIRHDFGFQSQPLYTIYAHMREINVALGQWVDTGTMLGELGDTGATTGPHLHIEVRVGENSYFNTLNPELWIAPPQGWGVLAGRVMETNREPIRSFPVIIRSQETNREWEVNTYGPEAVNADPYYNENMIISDLPAGLYTVRILYDGKNVFLPVEIRPGQVTYFSFRGQFGYSTELPNPTPQPSPTSAPE